jgi:hypothetical protein
MRVLASLIALSLQLLALGGCVSNMAAADWYKIYSKPGLTDADLTRDGLECHRIAVQRASSDRVKGLGTAAVIGSVLGGGLPLAIATGITAQSDGSADRAAQEHRVCMRSRGYSVNG